MGLQEITTDRVDELKAAVVSVMTERLRKNIEEINLYFEKNMDAVLDDLQGSIIRLYHKVEEAQQAGTLQELRFINAFFMKSELADGKLMVKLAAYDEEGIAKPSDISEIWYPNFISQYYQADIEYLQRNLDRVLFRPTGREKMIARMLYAEDYYKIVAQLLLVCGEAFEYIEGVERMKLCSEVSVSCSHYQEPGVCIYEFKECEVWNSL